MATRYGRLDLQQKAARSGTITMLNDSVKALSEMTKSLPIGTNLGMLHVLWMLVSGALLANRGAILGGLKSSGLSDDATRRAAKWQKPS